MANGVETYQKHNARRLKASDGFKNKSKMKSPLKLNFINIKYVACRYCDKLHKTQEDLIKHMEAIHGIKINYLGLDNCSAVRSQLPQFFFRPNEQQSQGRKKRQSSLACSNKISQLFKGQSADSDSPSDHESDFDINEASDGSSGCESDFDPPAKKKEKYKEHGYKNSVNREIRETCKNIEMSRKLKSPNTQVIGVKNKQVSDINLRLLLGLDVQKKVTSSMTQSADNNSSQHPTAPNTQVIGVKKKQASDINLRFLLGLDVHKKVTSPMTQSADNNSSNDPVPKFDLSNKTKEKIKNGNNVQPNKSFGFQLGLDVQQKVTSSMTQSAENNSSQHPTAPNTQVIGVKKKQASDINLRFLLGLDVQKKLTSSMTQSADNNSSNDPVPKYDLSNKAKETIKNRNNVQPNKSFGSQLGLDIQQKVTSSMTQRAVNNSSNDPVSNNEVYNKTKEKIKNGNNVQTNVTATSQNLLLSEVGGATVNQKFIPDKIVTHVPQTRQLRTVNEARNGPYSCSVCGKFWRCSAQLQHHMVSHSEEIKFICDHCGNRYKSKTSLNVHLKMISERHVCGECGRELCDKYSLAQHKELVHSEEQIKCETCGRLCNGKLALSHHITRIHKKMSVSTSCKDCNKVFSSKKLMYAHWRRIHKPEAVFTCNDCSAVFKYKNLLVTHIQTKHLPPAFKCRHCSEVFSSYQRLVYHLRKVHGIDKRPVFLCTVCGKRFKGKDKLIDHLRTHGGEKPHVCEVCGKCFRCATNLYQHSFTHSEERRYKCELCEKAFRIKHHLRQHMATHGLASVPKYGKRGQKLK